MASSKKKRVEEHMETRDIERNKSDDEDFDEENVGSDDDDADDEFIDQDVQVEFEARQPADSDFYGIRTLLQQLFLKASVNLAELTDTIISQNYIGNVIKQSDVPDEDDSDEEGDDPVFGVFTVVNLTEKKDLQSVQQIVSLLTEKGQQHGQGQATKFCQILNDPEEQIGFLISERFINIPPQIAVPSFESLRKDMEKAKQKKMKYDFSWFVMFSKTYRAKLGGQKAELLFSNPEEELIHEMCDINFTYSVAQERDSVVGGRWDEDEDMEALRTVIMFSVDKLDSIIQKLKTELSKT